MNETITKNQFSELINRKNPIANYNIDEEIEFKERGFRYPILITNCVFKSLFFLKNSRCFKSVTFENCIFENGIKLVECEICGSLEFKSCRIDSETIFKDCTLSSFLSKNTKYKELLFCGYLKNNALKNDDISFFNADFEKFSFNDLDCYKPIRLNSIKANSINIEKSSLYSDISFGNHESSQHISVEKIYIWSSNFNQRVDFQHGDINDLIYIQKVNFKEQVVFKRSIKFKRLYLTEVKSTRTFSIDYYDNFENLNISDCFFDTSFSIYSTKELAVYNHKVSIDFDGMINGNYIIDKIPTLSIGLSGINFGNIVIQNIETKFIIFNKFYNFSSNSKVLINTIKYNQDFNILVISDSNLGNTEFENIDFRKFNEVIIIKSEVSNIMLTNSLFPDKIQLKSEYLTIGYEIPLHEKINDNMYYRDSYRQLKLAMEKMGNRYYYLTYKSKEMYYHRKELKFGWDKLLLYINFLSNNNGISWTRGIIFTLSCSWISFIIMNSQLNEPLFEWTLNTTFQQTFHSFNISMKEYISYLSSYPILKMENIKDNCTVDLTILLSRIFVSVGIYQIITAFRKYGK